MTTTTTTAATKIGNQLLRQQGVARNETWCGTEAS